MALGVDLLPVKVSRDLFAVVFRNLLKGFFGDGQHSAGATGAIVKQIGAGFDSAGNGKKHETRHEFDYIAWRPVLSGLLVVVLIEHAHEVFEDGTHGVVVETGEISGRVRAEVDVFAEELFKKLAEAIGFGELW